MIILSLGGGAFFLRVVIDYELSVRICDVDSSIIDVA